MDSIAALREENEILRERIRQLEDVIAPRIDPPSGLHFTPRELTIYRQLKTGRLVSRDDFLTRIYGDNAESVSDGTLLVLLGRVRRKLASRGIRVMNFYGQGWRIPTDNEEGSRNGV